MAEARLVMRTLVDNALKAADDHHIGRVDDTEAEWRDDGRLFLTHIVSGPEALAGRVASRLRPLAHAVFRGRFDNRLPISEIVEVGPTLKLRQPSGHYRIGRSDLWVAKRILRWIPGAE
jgi:hypothetical protein